MRLVRSLVILLFATVTLLPNLADAAVTVEVAPIGVVELDGFAVSALVRVTCTPVGSVRRPLEAVLSLSQDNQSIFGEGNMTTILCNGLPNVQLVRVIAFERTFHRGTAHASAYVLVCNVTVSRCQGGQDSRNIQLA